MSPRAHQVSCSCRATDFPSLLAPDIERYLATDTATARDRVKLFRLAWDIAGSTFGSRQVLYERFFASDPLTRARALNTMYQKDAVMERVRRFLDEAGQDYCPTSLSAAFTASLDSTRVRR